MSDCQGCTYLSGPSRKTHVGCLSGVSTRASQPTSTANTAVIPPPPRPADAGARLPICSRHRGRFRGDTGALFASNAPLAAAVISASSCSAEDVPNEDTRRTMMIEGEWPLASPEMHRAQFLTEECQRGTLQTFSEAGTFGTLPSPKTHGRGLARAGRRILGPGARRRPRSLATGPAIGSPDHEDLILMCYMSRDFREGLDAFLNKRQPQWAGE